VGSDTFSTIADSKALNFNPRSPRGERPTRVARYCCKCLFQSTLPAWGATLWHHQAVRSGNISIHAPRVGSDQRPTSAHSNFQNFNPRSPRGERLRGAHGRMG